MDPNKIFTLITSSFILLILLSLFMIVTGCTPPIDATGSVRV
jgi:hypothetical protein